MASYDTKKPMSPSTSNAPQLRKAKWFKSFPTLSKFYLRMLVLSVLVLAAVHIMTAVSFTDVSFAIPSAASSAVNSLKLDHQISLTGPNSSTHAEPVSLARENATFVTLARNGELDDLIPSIQSFEDRFNHKFHYDWVFLNNEPFSEKFKEKVSSMVSGTAKFGLIPKEHWGYPDFIDTEQAAKARKQISDKHVPYGGLESYRHMCRFESGFFYQHDLMKQYRYYWRVEPATAMYCDVDYDVFKFFREKKKKYGFTIALYEFRDSIPTLWQHTMDFLKQNPAALNDRNLWKFVSDDGDTYNLCHFWSNFEIADMEFWRGEIYSKYFDFLDKTGGFFYERWGDAPVHSLAAALFMDRDEIHFFDDMGYSHAPHTQCPFPATALEKKCSCNPSKSFVFHQDSCATKYFDAVGYNYQDHKKAREDEIEAEELARVAAEKAEQEEKDRIAIQQAAKELKKQEESGGEGEGN